LRSTTEQGIVICCARDLQQFHFVHCRKQNKQLKCAYPIQMKGDPWFLRTTFHSQPHQSCIRRGPRSLTLRWYVSMSHGQSKSNTPHSFNPKAYPRLSPRHANRISIGKLRIRVLRLSISSLLKLAEITRRVAAFCSSAPPDLGIEASGPPRN
jgi:hypothetical protein